MDKLVKIIGPAPSEMTDEEFAIRLRKERVRVTTALEEYSYQAKTSKPRAKAKPLLSSQERKLKTALEELGMTPEEFVEAYKEEQQKKEEVKGEPMK